jgi:S-(hydroxymethyl)glutathione dehydrogenase/alcohol dehydrogenase
LPTATHVNFPEVSSSASVSCESAAVVGVGGVGLNVIQALRIVGAYPIVAIDISEEKLTLASSLGAHHTVLRPRDSLEAARAHVPYGFDWAFEVLGRPETILDAWSLIRSGGTVVVVGLAPKASTVSIPAFDFISEKNLRGCFYGSSHFRADLPTLIEWARLGWLKLDPLVSRTRPLDELEEAFGDLRQGKGVRTVIRF